ncbi:hypothetical protein KKG61_02135 [bacterium]|nr:hypothetical protein [bacterium]MBU1598900.1 hypothetical protein [bacterium]
MYYFELLEELYKDGIRYLIVGGLAVNLHGVPRVTQDIDIVIAMERENILKLNAVLKKLGYKPRLPVNPDDMVNSKIVKDWVVNKNLKAFSFYHQKENYKVVDIVLVHQLDFEDAFKNKSVKKAQNIEIYLVSIDDLIKMKKSAGRSQDSSDVKMLKKVKRYIGEDNNG